MPIDPTPKPFRGPWEGDTKIVIGIDIGTTQSGVAFAFLQNGASQVIHRVTRWPGQEAHNQQSKIPTLVWYDINRTAVSFGAEAQLPTIEEQAEDNGWMLAKHFQLHLHPSDMQARHGLKLDPLPDGVNLRQIYSDFLGYLLKHTGSYFENHVVDGKSIWKQYSLEVAIAHPNGWGIREQAFLRSAAVAAGFATAEDALTKIRFVTEAEASVHFCIHHTNMGSVLRAGMNFAVCDAGESTVNTTIYGITSARPVLKLEEKRASACIQAGAIFVNFEAEKYLRRTFSGAGLSPEDVAEYTKTGVKDFENFAKRAFKDETTEQSVMVTYTRFHNSAIRTRYGRMTLSGLEIKGFFEPCVKAITASVDQELEGLSVQSILLVGEFANNLYLRQVFQKRYEPRGYQVLFVHGYWSGPIAAAEGAIVWNVMMMMYWAEQPAPRFSWGTETPVAFNYNDLDHRDRRTKASASGRILVPGRWHGLIQKGVVIDEGEIVRVPTSLNFPPLPSELGEFKLDLYHYSGDDEPVWMRNKQGGLLPKFSKAVHVYTNLDDLYGALKPRIDRDGTLQYQLNFDICMRFGGVELVAYSEWEEERIIRTGRCTLAPVIDQA